MKTTLKTLLSGTAGLALMAQAAWAVDLEFYFPVAVGGDAAGAIQALVDAYLEQTPDVSINAIYTGSYLPRANVETTRATSYMALMSELVE